MLRSSGGNVRLFLQLCSLLFTVAAPKEAPIDHKLAQEALSRETSPVPDKEGLRVQLTKLLTAAHISFQAGYPLGAATVDFAVTDVTGGFRAFIVLTEALFGAEELDVAQMTLDLVRNAQNRSRPAEVVLVVSGYMSPELTLALGEVHRVIVVTTETGREEIAPLVHDLRTSASSTASGDTAILEERLAAVQASLAALERERARESETLSERLSDLADTQVARRRIGELDETRSQWRAAEEKIDAEMRTARQQRQKAELDELERLRAGAEKDRRWLVILGLALVTVILMVFGGTILSNALFIYWWPGALLGLAAAVFVAVPILAFLYAPRRARDVAGPVGSIEELNRLAQAYAVRPAIFGRTPGRLLRSRNPQIRYAATFMRRPVASLYVLSHALASERSAIIRRSLVKFMVTEYERDGLLRVLDIADSNPEVSAVFDSLHTIRDRQVFSHLAHDPETRWPDRIAPEFLTLGGIYGFGIFKAKLNLLDRFILEIQDNPYTPSMDKLADSREENMYAAVSMLSDAYIREDDIAMLRALSSCPERDLRAAAATLSPFDTGRLGTFDWLTKIEDIDQIYLFFRKCLFYLGRGVTAVSPLYRD